MPIEDAMADWGQEDRDFIKLATIVIRPKESFDRFGKELGLNWPISPPAGEDGPRLLARSEDLSFSPWHGLTEHEPLGGINRVRRRVYEVMSKLRHDRNGRSQVEPEKINAHAEMIQTSLRMHCPGRLSRVPAVVSAGLDYSEP